MLWFKDAERKEKWTSGGEWKKFYYIGRHETIHQKNKCNIQGECNQQDRGREKYGRKARQKNKNRWDCRKNKSKQVKARKVKRSALAK